MSGPEPKGYDVKGSKPMVNPAEAGGADYLPVVRAVKLHGA